MTETVPLPKFKPAIPSFWEALAPEFDTLAGLLSQELPFLILVVVIAIVVYLLRKRRTRTKRVSDPPIPRSQRSSPSRATLQPGPLSASPPEHSISSRQPLPEPPKQTLSPQEQWHQLCKYARNCVQAEAAESLVPVAEIDVSWFGHSGTEQLVVGHADRIPAPRKLVSSLDSLPDSPQPRSLVYGWPTVVLEDRDRRTCVAPLFIVQIEQERDSDGQWQLHAVTEPDFNQAIAATGAFGDSIAEEVSDLLGAGWPFGNQDACTDCAAKTAELIGLTLLSTLDPAALDPHIRRNSGVYNAAISVYAANSNYNVNLIKELRELQERDDWTSTAAAHLIPGVASRDRDRPAPTTPLASPLQCNQSQERTLQRIRTHPLTIVTGPPGTGKTELVVNAVSNAWLDDEKVLVTSTNNAAVDVAVDRAIRKVFRGLLIRTGNRDERQDVPDRVRAALDHTRAIRGRPYKPAPSLKDVAERRAAFLRRLELLDTAENDLLAVAQSLETVQCELTCSERRLWPLGVPRQRLHSPDRIEHHAHRLLRGRFFPSFRSRRFRRKLRCLDSAPLTRIRDWARLEQERSSLRRRIAALRHTYSEHETVVGDLAETLKANNEEWADASLDAVRSHAAARLSLRPDKLIALARTPARADALRKSIAATIDHLRGWACTALSTNRNFALESGLFDLVIVDEASQCTLAAILPLAYRAKRLAVIGDPVQLQPIVRVSHNALRKIAEDASFDNDEIRTRNLHHKDGSAYLAFETAAGDTNPPVLLDEHYRCHPHIAQWFNRTFYNGKLAVLTELDEADRPIFWQDVAGEAQRGRDGTSWLNHSEAREVVRHLEHLFRSGLTVGVVTPYRGQAQCIERLVKETFSPDIWSEAQFVCATAHRFQGSERDAIVISCVISPEMNRSSARWIENDNNLINVAVSRARRSLIVLGHPEIGELGVPTLASLRAYLRDEVPREGATHSALLDFRADSQAERLLFDAMTHRGLRPSFKLNVVGHELDFALLDGCIKLNIEVDGDQHFDTRRKLRRQDVARDRILENRGWTVRRFAAWRCHADLESLVDEIEAAQRDLLSRRSPD